MSDTSANNKRIAKNTAFLYLRMFISMSVSLYTSRVILQTLGIEDYGVYNIVGGVVAMFSFINSTMSSATSRFLTFEIGRGNKEKLKETFNASLWVHVIIAVIILVLCETIGLWFLQCKMIIPQGREMAANVVFQLSIISTLISITQVPYNATLIAHEKLDIYAYVEMINVFLRLGILYVLVLVNVDKLILYGVLVLLVSTCIAMFYRYYCIKHYEECHIKMKIEKEIVKPMLSFSGWDFYGNMSVTARTQGVSMLLNVFFGPIMNAAAGIATSVQSAVMSFATNVNTAVRPQIIKYFAKGEYKEMESLINNACKLNFLIMALIMVPLCAEIDYILKLWLGEVPDLANVFCVLTLSFNLFANMSYLIVTGVHAYGNIIRPSLINGSLYLMVIPVTYFAFELGAPAWTSYLFNLVAVFIGMLSNAYTLHKYVNDYSVSTFFWSVLSRCFITLLIGGFVSSIIISCLESSVWRVALTVICSTLSMGTIGFYMLLSENMRKKIKVIISSKLCKKD